MNRLPVNHGWFVDRLYIVISFRDNLCDIRSVSKI